METKEKYLLIYNENDKTLFIKNSIFFPSLTRAEEFAKITGIETFEIYKVELVKNEGDKNETSNG